MERARDDAQQQKQHDDRRDPPLCFPTATAVCVPLIRNVVDVHMIAPLLAPFLRLPISGSFLNVPIVVVIGPYMPFAIENMLLDGPVGIW